jgi:hypothetical protein
MTTVTFTFDPLLPARTAMVEKILVDSLPGTPGVDHVIMIEVDAAIEKFNAEGPYDMAKRLGLLVNNSAEEMSIEFMSFVNKIYPNTY